MRIYGTQQLSVNFSNNVFLKITYAVKNPYITYSIYGTWPKGGTVTAWLQKTARRQMTATKGVVPEFQPLFAQNFYVWKQLHQSIIKQCPKVHVHFVFRSDQRKMGAIILAERHKHNHGANVPFSPPLSGVCIPVCYTTCPRLPQRDHRRDQKHLQSSKCITCPWSLYSFSTLRCLWGSMRCCFHIVAARRRGSASW